MKVKNYSYATIIKKALPLFLMMLFVNVGWGQITIFSENMGSPSGTTTIASNVFQNSTLTFTGSVDVRKTTPSDTYSAASGSGNVWFASGAKEFQISGVNTSAFSSLSLEFGVLASSANNMLIVEVSANGIDYTTLSVNSTIAANKWTLKTATGSIPSTENLRIRFSKSNTITFRLDDVKITGVVSNTAPSVSDVSITGLPNTTVLLTGSYTYDDTEEDVDASTYQWYTATDDAGTGATAIVGATVINYTLTTNELGKYIRLGVLAASSTGTSPGLESFSPWIGPVNAAGTSVLVGGSIADFDATCLNVTSEPNSFTLSGNNLTGNVTVEALSGFSFSETVDGTYTSTLSLTPVSEEINTTIYVKFTPTAEGSYNGNFTVSGGGANSVLVNVVAQGINTPVSITTDIVYGETNTEATATGNFVEGCSPVTSYGIEFSTVDGFTGGAGTAVASSNANAGNFTATLSGLQSGTLYYYIAYATDANGTVYGAQNSLTTTAIEEPTATAATVVTQTGFTANWDAVAGATGYELDVYSKEITTSPELVTNGSFESASLSNFSFETAMNQEVSTAQNHSGFNSLYSTVVATKNFNQDVDVVFGQEYTLKFWYYIDESATGNGFRVWTTVGADIKLPSSNTFYNIKGSWQLVEENFTSSDNSVKLNFRLYNGVKIYFDDISVTLAANSSMDTPVLGSPFTATVSQSSYNVTGLDSNKEYFYKVRAKDATSTSISSNEISVSTKPTSVTWNGTAWSNTTGPDETIDAVIDGDLITAGNLTAKSLTINTGKSVTIGAATTLTVVNEITNNAGVANFTIQSDGVVLQTATTANTASFATVERNATELFRQDYTLWSSPVVGQNLRNFSPLTLYTRFYTYGYLAGQPNGSYIQEIMNNEDVTSKFFQTATGYLIRMQNTNPELVGYLDGTTAMTFKGVFQGNLNNGNVSTPLVGSVPAVSNGFTLVGNPYPSPVSISALFTQNPQITRTLYFWRKKNSANTVGSGYASYSEIGMASIDSTIDTQILTHIKTGQGFFVKTNDVTPTPLVFNNDMRSNVSTIFFKSPTDTPTELHRFWLNLADSNAVVGQTLVAYATNATQEVDANIDAVYFNDAPTALTSIINNNEYIIQGRSLPFTTNDVVPLGFKTDVAGSFTISLPNYDGLFAENQDIYLKDKANNTLHNLKAGDYTFTTEPGVFNTRFEVQYNTTLSSNNPSFDGNAILIAVKNQQIKINAGALTMHKIELIDVAGRVIYTQDNVSTTTASIDNLAVSNQMLIVRITTAENGVVNQKIVF